METININSDYLIFTLIDRSMEIHDDSVLTFMGRCSDPFISETEVKIRRTLYNKLDQYIDYLEQIFNENLQEFLLITTTKIVIISTLNYRQVEEVHQFTSPPYFREIIAHLSLCYQKNQSEQIQNHEAEADLLINEGIIIPYITYMAYNDCIDMEAMNNLLLLLKQDHGIKEDYIRLSNGTSDKIIKHFIAQILEEKFGTKTDLNIAFEQYFDLLQSINIDQFEAYEVLAEIISKVTKLNIREMSGFANQLFFRYLAEDASAFNYDLHYLFNIYLHLFAFELQKSTISEEFLNFMNSFIIVVENKKGSIYFQFILNSIVVKLYIDLLRLEKHYSKQVNLGKFQGYYENYIINYRLLVQQGEDFDIAEIQNINVQISDIFQDQLSTGSNWERFILKNIKSLNKYADFIDIHRVDGTRIYSNREEFEKEVENYFDIQREDPVFDLFLIHLISKILDVIIHQTVLNPELIIRNVSIFTLLDDLIGNIEKDLLETYKSKFKVNLSFKPYREIHHIIFGKSSSVEKITKLQLFFDEINNNRRFEQLYYHSTQVRALKWIIDHIHDLEPSTIHSFLDILDLRSTNAYTKVSAMKRLIRSYLNEELIDDLTRYYLDKYLDRGDYDRISREELDDIIKQLDNTDRVEIDLENLKMELEIKQNSEQMDDENIDHNIPDLPKVLFDLFDDDGNIPDYFIFFNTYHYIRRRLKLTNMDEELRELINYLLNHHPYMDRLQPYFGDMTHLRHEYDDIVDDIMFELLEIETIGKVFPEQALNRLHNYFEELIEGDRNPTLEDYEEIIRIFQYLRDMVGGHKGYEDYMILSRLLQMYRRYLRELYTFREVLQIGRRITTGDYLVLEKETEIIPLIFFLLEIVVKTIGERDREIPEVNESDLTELLKQTQELWESPEKLQNITHEWLQFSKKLLAIIDRMGVEFGFAGFTKTRLYLVEMGILEIDELYNFLQENHDLYYQLYAQHLTARYFRRNGRPDLAITVLEHILALCSIDPDLDTLHEILMKVGQLADDVDHQSSIEIINFLYQKHATTDQYEEYDRNKKQKIYLKQENQEDDIYQPLVDMFETDEDTDDVLGELGLL